MALRVVQAHARVLAINFCKASDPSRARRRVQKQILLLPSKQMFARASDAFASTRNQRKDQHQQKQAGDSNKIPYGVV